MSTERALPNVVYLCFAFKTFNSTSCTTEKLYGSLEEGCRCP